MSEGNQKCKNCGYEAGHHSSSSGMCPTLDGTTYYEAKEEVNFTPKPHFVFTGWRAPKDPVRIKVPEGMLDAAMQASMEAGLGIGPSTELRVVLEAALRWQSKNTPHPTDKEFGELVVSCSSAEKWEHLTEWMRAGMLCHEWVCRMYLAPEPEVPEEIKDLLYDPKDGPTKVDRNDAIIEAYRRGQRRRGQNSQARQ